MEQERLEGLVREILGNDYRELQLTKYALEEDVEDQQASIVCRLTVANGEARAVEGKGVGLVDALFRGLQAGLAEDYPSLDHIRFVDFGIAGDFNEPATGTRSDALGHVRLGVENSAGRRFDFESATHSVSASSVKVVLKAVEHFVNAELAVLRMYEWIEDANRRQRVDLAEKYTHRLSELVQNASYSESIERYRQKLGR